MIAWRRARRQHPAPVAHNGPELALGSAAALLVAAALGTLAGPVPAAAATADLIVGASADPDPVATDNDLTARFTIQNQGPDDAADVWFHAELSAPATFQFVTPSDQCSYTGDGYGGAIVCGLGAIAVTDPGRFVAIRTVPVTAGVLWFPGTVSHAADSDTDTTNNAVTAAVTVAGGSGGGDGDGDGEGDGGGSATDDTLPRLGWSHGPNAPLGGTVHPGDRGVRLLVAQAKAVRVAAPDAFLHAVTLGTHGGAEPATEVVDVRLSLDADGDGVADPNEELLARGSFAPGSVTMTLRFDPPRTLAGGDDEVYVVVADLRGGAGAAAGTVVPHRDRRPAGAAALALLALAATALATRRRRPGARAAGWPWSPAAAALLLLATAVSCGDDSGPPGPGTRARTLGLEITAVDARSAADGRPAERQGLPLAGEAVLIVGE